MSTVKKTLHAGPPGSCLPIESPTTAQDIDCISEIDQSNDLPAGAPDPVTLIVSDSHHHDTKHLPLDEILPADCVTERAVYGRDHHDICTEQPSVSPDV